MYTVFATFNDFVLEYDVIMLIGGLLVIFVAFDLYQRRGYHRRRKRLGHRDILSENQWFGQYYPVSAQGQKIVRKILMELANDVRVEWTQLRPSDKFQGVLRIDPKYAPSDDLEHTAIILESMLESLEERDIEPPQFEGSLADFLDRLLLRSGLAIPKRNSL